MATIQRPKEDQNFWNFLFSIVFAVLFGLSAYQMYLAYDGFPNDITLFDAVLIALATFRLIRLFVYDKITRFLREMFLQKKVANDIVELTPYPRGLRRTISDLLGCPWCLGVWIALAVVYTYYMFDWSWYVILVLAVAGVASLFQVTVNLIGWKAELSKLEAQAKEHEKTLSC